MSRNRPAAAVLVAAALLAFSPVVSAASDDAAMEAPRWSAGDRWTFDTRLFIPDADPIDATATATYAGVEPVGEPAREAHRVDTRHEGQREGETLSVWYATEGFAKLQVASSSPGGTTTYRLASPCPEWRFPLRVGDTWTTSCTFEMQGGEPFTVDSRWEVVRRENVAVPAGAFDALVLEQSGEGFVERWWFAPEACYWVRHESADAEGNLQVSETLTGFACATPQAEAEAQAPPPEGDAQDEPPAADDAPAEEPTTTATPPREEDAAADAPAAQTPPPEEGERAPTPGPGVPLALVAAGVALVARRAKRT